VQVFERVTSLVRVDGDHNHRPLAGFSVTIADCGAMPASYRSPVHGAALRNELAVTMGDFGRGASSPLAPSASVVAVASPATTSTTLAPAAAPSLPEASHVPARHASGPVSSSFSRRFVYLLVQVRVPGGLEDFSERVVMELFDDVVPKTAENFRCLCTGERVRASVVDAVKML
jgi:hypothetical protein